MKKRFLLTCAAATLLSGAQAQRHCGTMEYHEFRKSKNPAVEQRMNESEVMIQNWIKNNEKTKSSQNVFPKLKGFSPTGNAASDRIAYRAAKEKFLADRPVQKHPYDAAELKALREQKKLRHNSTH
jgi:hypothetical protein